MPRRAPAALALLGLAGTACLGGLDDAASAAGGHTQRPVSSVAVLASDNATFRVAANVAGATPRRTARLVTHDNRSVAGAIAADGEHGLLCADSNRIYPVRALRTKARLGQPIDASRFSGEGGKTFTFFCDGLSAHGGFALAAGDSQGVVQLVLRKGSWKVDRRVRTPGTNEAGRRHRPGWIRFAGPATSSTYRSVSVAPQVSRNAGRLAVSLDRADGTLAVVQDVGTPKAHYVGSLTTPRLVNHAAAYGTAGVAWQPAAGNRAIVATAHGFAVLDLGHPGHPRLLRSVTVGSGVSPRSLSVSADGNHLAVAAGNRVYGYGHVRDAVGHGRRFRLQTSFRLGRGRGELVTDVAYTPTDSLAVLHGVSGGAWSLTLVGRVPRGHHHVNHSMPTTRPGAAGSLTVWPPA